MSINQIVPLLNIEDMTTSANFYVDGLGFEITREWRPDGDLQWCHLQRDGIGIMIQRHPKQRHDAVKGDGVALCVFCDDALALYREFTSRGISVDEPFVGNGLWVAGVSDPDGYRLEFESPTDVPEETKLSEIPNLN